MEGSTTGQVIFAFGAATAGALALWWLWQERRSRDGRSVDPSIFTRPVARVVKMWVYPVKSCRGLELTTTTECGIRGFTYDRSWVIVDGEGTFMTQRKYPKMALITPRVEAKRSHRDGGEENEEEEGVLTLHLSAPGMSDIAMDTPPSDAPTQNIRVWRLSGEASDMGEEVGLWLDQFLEKKGCRMFYMAPHHKARISVTDKMWAEYSREGEEARFPDNSPILMISEASLELLNSKMEEPLPMLRFRPNIVVSGCLPHSEDDWNEVKVGDVIIRKFFPCNRCKMTTVNPESGEFAGPEPLETLRKYRRYETLYNEKNSNFSNNSPLFGVRYAVSKAGTISIGDTVTIAA